MKKKIETDPKKTKRLAQKLESENWDFRVWLKFYAPENIDEIVSALSRKYFSVIDCKNCGNCCRSLSAVSVSRSELRTMESHGSCPHVVDNDEIKVQLPCPMLDGNLCSIYADRPETCRKYPYLEEPGFVSRLVGVINNTFVCPIVFNVFEELKSVLNWARH